VECNLPEDVKIVTETSSKIGFTFKPRQVVLHNNKCKFLGNGIYTDPSSCKFFLLCNNARSNRMKCPLNLLFDSARLTCDYPEKAFCNVTSNTTTPTIETTTIVTTTKPLETTTKHLDTTTKPIDTTTKPHTTKMLTTIKKTTHLPTTKHVAYTSKKWFPSTTFKPHTTKKWFPSTTFKPHTTKKWFPKTTQKPRSTREWLEYTTQKPYTTRKWVPNTTRKPRRTRKVYKTNKWYRHSTRKPRTRKRWFKYSTQRPYTTETDIEEHHGHGNVPDSFWYGPSGHV